MSFAAYQWAESQFPKTAGGKLVLYGLAGFADDNGFCHPSQSTLADRVDISLRSVNETLSGLQSEGYLSRLPCRRRDGRRGVDHYILNFGTEVISNVQNLHIGQRAKSAQPIISQNLNLKGRASKAEQYQDRASSIQGVRARHSLSLKTQGRELNRAGGSR